jgi:hypothetical protein
MILERLGSNGRLFVMDQDRIRFRIFRMTKE